MYKISKTLRGHSNDVRGLTVVDGTIISCSRDGTVKKWEGKIPYTVLNSSAGSFINAIDSIGSGLIASGGKDCIIFINSIDDSEVDVGTISNLIGHQNNICSLSSKDNLLISSSWDGTAKVWDIANNFETVYTLENGNSVLDAIIVTPTTFLTCSSDRLIKLWNKDKIVKTFSGHKDVVRKLIPLDEQTFASCSNDGTIMIWNYNGQIIKTLSDHESFIYDMILLPNGYLVSSSEDRSVRIWKNYELHQVITLPSISNWCLSNIGNDIVVGTSDNSIRVFTLDSDKVDIEEVKDLEESIKNSTIAEQSLEINKTDVPGYDRLEQPGKEGQTIMVKNYAGTIEAHQWSNNQWNKIGDVVSAAGSEKKTYNGKEYDYVFDVDIEDGKPPLKLPFNVTDNVYTTAEKFLADNELPNSYTQEVVNFIQKNTQGHSITETSAAPTSDVSSTAPTKKAKKSLTILPVKEFIKFNEFKNEQLVKGLTKFNQSNGNRIDVPFNFEVSSKESLEFINTIVKEVFTWDESSYVIGFDLLRVLVPKLGISDIISDENLPRLILSFIEQGIKSDNPTSLMMLLKFLCNLIDTVLFIQIYLTEDGDVQFSHYLVDLLTQFKDKLDSLPEHKHTNQFLTTLSTFIYDLSVLQLKKSITNLDLCIFFGKNKLNDYGESLYRLAIAYGNLKTMYLKLPKWDIKSNESRFDSLIEELELLN